MESKPKIKLEQEKILKKLEEKIGKPIPLLDVNIYKKIPSNFGIMTKKENIESLRLEGCNLTAVPEEITLLNSLIELDLRKNQIEILPESIANLQTLQILRLNDNRIKKLPDSICDLYNLLILNLDGNKLTSLPEEFGLIESLADLSLDSNHLRTLPDSFEELVALYSLSLNNNNFKSFPKCCGSLDSLRSLFLRNNKLTKISDTLWTLSSSLEEIDLEGNPINEEELRVFNTFLNLKDKIANMIYSREFKTYFKDDIFRASILKRFESLFKEIQKDKIAIFISYALSDSKRLQISDIAKGLGSKSSKFLIFWYEGWDGYPEGDIIDFMENFIEQSFFFIPICTQASTESQSCELERKMALHSHKIMIPLFEDFKYVPTGCRPYRGIDILGKSPISVIDELYNQILSLI